MARDRFAPDFDPDCGDVPLTTARQDIVIGRWRGLRELLRATGPDWAVRGHRVRLLAQACAGSSTAESWLAAEPKSADALVLRAATETARAFHLAIAAGRGVPIDQQRVDTAVMACLQAADACPDDPTPWISLIYVARLYPSGVRRQELARWWDELHQRDPFSVEGHLQVLHYYSSRWHGTHGLMYDFARDGAVSDVRRTWLRWITGRPEGVVTPVELRDLNYLTHAACQAGLPDIAGALFRLLGRRATRTPWSYTGEPDKQLVKWRKELRVST
jgi:hypothetical protein